MVVVGDGGGVGGNGVAEEFNFNKVRGSWHLRRNYTPEDANSENMEDVLEERDILAHVPHPPKPPPPAEPPKCQKE